MEALKIFDDAAPVSRETPEPIRREARIYNGFYTLTFPDGSHRTFRVHTKKADAKFAPGKRIISILIGPQNTTDYEGFGFVSETGVTVWKSKRGPKDIPSKLESYAGIIWDLATGEAIDGYSLHVSRRCLRCNRELTDPESIERGIGPVCSEFAE